MRILPIFFMKKPKKLLIIIVALAALVAVLPVVSQRFHNERCIILGDWQGMQLTGFNAE